MIPFKSKTLETNSTPLKTAMTMLVTSIAEGRKVMRWLWELTEEMSFNAAAKYYETWGRHIDAAKELSLQGCYAIWNNK